jgi:hypothetical protein
LIDVVEFRHGTVKSMCDYDMPARDVNLKVNNLREFAVLAAKDAMDEGLVEAALNLP